MKFKLVYEVFYEVEIEAENLIEAHYLAPTLTKVIRGSKWIRAGHVRAEEITEEKRDFWSNFLDNAILFLYKYKCQ